MNNGIDPFTEDQIESIAQDLFVKSFTSERTRLKTAKEVNWALEAKKLWQDYKTHNNQVYIQYVSRVRKVVRAIESRGCEIRIIQ